MLLQYFQFLQVVALLQSCAARSLLVFVLLADIRVQGACHDYLREALQSYILSDHISSDMIKPEHRKIEEKRADNYSDLL